MTSLVVESFTVVVAADPLDGGYVVTVKELPGCASQGETVGEALRSIADAYEGVTGNYSRTTSRLAMLRLGDRSVIERRVVAALRSAVDAHGPITRENVSSAAKRVFSELKAVAREQRV